MALLEAMNAIVQFVVSHGYPIVFAAVFARQIGLPVPAPAFLIAAGALAASGNLGFVAVVDLAVLACVLADWVWYEAGRSWGDKVLRFIHHLARDPEAHGRRAKRIFAEYGPPFLVLARFAPGLDALAPPLAGTSRTPRICFLAFETVGAGLWSISYTTLGYVFNNRLDRAAAYAGKAGALLVGLLVFAGLSIYGARKLVHWRRSRGAFRVMRITEISPMGCGTRPS
jgi:membrane protein DedA with SNARE-associated domain